LGLVSYPKELKNVLSPGKTIPIYQHIATLIGGRNMLRAFQPPYCDVLGVVGTNLTIFKLEPTTSNMSQHIATR